ncbi:saccharopine dehydrogenase NADP-binding domain-containing protein [Sinirhodobacter sp. WL0062]|uniref:Saccharopine dehydrogenase NADP-binding domain-containing protein n=1 Tax=Rhodobacter flavimaris TaxID=2907145 RepID=A0ABS8Z0A8_9RHOB|nr:saccharopine dehydrogenase C-terminal domain-containing protein [Sinirhodobacter sp. WL0062]MCE5974965.1 saccharopine dehydrogenase NADP-binding domain-containing protein [Sinirhodobacter sp. WL0062]
MDKVVILGAGRIGRRIAGLLRDRAQAVLLDHDPAKLDLAKAAGLPAEALPPGVGREALRRALTGATALIVVEAVLPSADLVALACEAGCHYLDLNESDASAKDVARAAKGAPGHLRFAPGCGLAPGYVTALLAEEIARAPRSAEITAYVGVLPITPVNRLGYANIWGVPGLLQEYTRPVIGLRGGQVAASAPLGDYEALTIDGIALEAFSTAGSIDALARAREGQVQGLSFKTLRYPGHLEYMLFLLDDLGLRQQLHRLTSLLMTSLPATEADRVVIALRSVAGAGSRPRWITRQYVASPDSGSAMATLAAAHTVAMLDHMQSSAAIGPVLMPGDTSLDDLRRSPAFALLEQAAPHHPVPA